MFDIDNQNQRDSHPDGSIKIISVNLQHHRIIWAESLNLLRHVTVVITKDEHKYVTAVFPVCGEHLSCRELASPE